MGGIPAGVYVVFGKFADDWRPSEGAPGTARATLQQKWAIPGPTPGFMNGNAQYVPLNDDGSFITQLTVSESDAAGNYGIYTYAGSGAVNAAEELAVPVTLATAP